MNYEIDLHLDADTAQALTAEAAAVGVSEETLALLAVHLWLHVRHQHREGASVVIAGTPGVSNDVNVDAVTVGQDVQMIFSSPLEQLPTWEFVVNRSDVSPRSHLRLVD